MAYNFSHVEFVSIRVFMEQTTRVIIRLHFEDDSSDWTPQIELDIPVSYNESDPLHIIWFRAIEKAKQLLPIGLGGISENDIFQLLAKANSAEEDTQ